MPNAAARPGTHVLVAGVSARACAESAAHAGYRVTSLDAFGDLDRAAGVTARSLSRDFGTTFSAASLAQAAASIESETVVYLSPFENHPSSVSRLASGRTLWGNGLSVLRQVRDPSLIAQLLVPEHERGDARADDRWLLKPRASGGGHGIAWWRPGDVVPKGAYRQRFIDGVAGSIVFVAGGGQACPIGLTRQLVGERAFGATGFRYCGSILAATHDAQFEHDAELLEAACRLARIAAQEFALVGVNGIDFVARGGTPFVTEVNPRYSASMELVERAYGLSVFGAHATACSGGGLPSFELTRARTAMRAFGKAIVFARHDVVCGDTREWLDDATVRDVPHPGEHIPAGRPVCTVFADAADAAACHSALEQRAAALYETLESWTTVSA